MPSAANRFPEHRLQRAFAVSCVVAGGCAIALATLIPLPDQATASAETALFCFPCGEIGAVDVVVNILLFLPLGLGLRLVGIRWGRAVLIAALVSGLVEFLQGTVIPGRDAAFSDIGSNSIGGALGVSLGGIFWRLTYPSRRVARRLAWTWAGVIITVMGGSAYFLLPSWPATPWWGQWQPRHLHTDNFLGTLVDARIAGIPIPADSLRSGDSIRTALRAGAPLEAVIVTGPPTATIAPILRLAFNDNEVAMISQSRRDIVLRIRLRTADALLKTPSVRLAGVLPATAGDTVRIAASYFSHTYRIRATVHGTVFEGQGTMHPAFGWTTLLPIDYAIDDDARWFAALWLAVLFLPIGYWLSLPNADWSRSRRGAPLVLALIGALAAVPIAFGFSVAGIIMWLGAASGVVSGAGVARVASAMSRAGYAVDDEPVAAIGGSDIVVIAPR